MSTLVGQGELLTKLMLVTAAKRVTSNVTIPPNKVAVTIALCIPEAVAGWVTAGSRVSVFGTYVPHYVNGTADLAADLRCRPSGGSGRYRAHPARGGAVGPGSPVHRSSLAWRPVRLLLD